MERANAACSCCVDQRFCRLIGPAIGWMGIVTSIMVMKVFTQKSTEESVSLQVDIYDNIIVVVSASNFLAACCWLVGLRNDNRALLRVILFWWAINLCLALLCISCYFFENKQELLETTLFLLTVTVYWICSNVIAVLCYKSKQVIDGEPKGREPKAEEAKPTNS